ncbi:hypothetical protein V8C37DRAFT_290858 [Trichoderma ceciliae]
MSSEEHDISGCILISYMYEYGICGLSSVTCPSVARLRSTCLAIVILSVNVVHGLLGYFPAWDNCAVRRRPPLSHVHIYIPSTPPFFVPPHRHLSYKCSDIREALATSSTNGISALPRLASR